jgi:hypothetical protein
LLGINKIKQKISLPLLLRLLLNKNFLNAIEKKNVVLFSSIAFKKLQNWMHWFLLIE